MLMGLTNAPTTFQAFMNHIFQDMTDIFVVIYLDDILIFSDSLEEHRVHVRRVLEHLHKYDLHSKPQKCLFHMQKIEFLGFMVTPNGISMDTTRPMRSVSGRPRLTSKQSRHSWVSPTFIIDSLRGSPTSSSLDSPHPKGYPVHLGPDHTKAFETLKTAFTQPPSWRIFNPDNPIVVETDTSDYAIAAIISQVSPTMATSTRSHSTHAACSQRSSTTRSMTMNCSPYSRPSDNGATTSRALHMSS